MIKRKGYTRNEKDECIEYYYYEPELPVDEAANIAKALKPLRFKVQGFCREGLDKYVLQLRFVSGQDGYAPEDSLFAAGLDE